MTTPDSQEIIDTMVTRILDALMEKAQEPDRAYGKRIPEHMLDGVRNYVEHGLPPGGFMSAIFENNFVEATKRADEGNSQALWHWAYVLNWAPIGCWGSAAKVDEWIEGGGLRGLLARDVKRQEARRGG